MPLFIKVIMRPSRRSTLWPRDFMRRSRGAARLTPPEEAADAVRIARPWVETLPSMLLAVIAATEAAASNMIKGVVLAAPWPNLTRATAAATIETVRTTPAAAAARAEAAAAARRLGHDTR